MPYLAYSHKAFPTAGQGREDRPQGLLTAAFAEEQEHVVALDEMTAAEKAHAFISRATKTRTSPGSARRWRGLDRAFRGEL
jgi:hypothetical protein